MRPIYAAVLSIRHGERTTISTDYTVAYVIAQVLQKIAHWRLANQHNL